MGTNIWPERVSTVSDTGWTNGDPFLQQQNEPSLAVSTSHLFGDANDYRSADAMPQITLADAELFVLYQFGG